MRWTEEQYREFLARSGIPGAPTDSGGAGEVVSRAKGRLPPSAMNKTESAYDAHLWLLRHSGAILWHKFDAVSLRLADKTWFHTDFSVLEADGTFCIRETKGWMRDDAAVKLKTAAAMYPFRFVLVRKVGDGWSETEIAKR